MPERHTLCHTCGREAAHVCKLCGRHVCDAHYDGKLGICTACRRGKIS